MDSRITGKTIGRFQLVGILGEGAQGTVYLADDAHLGRQVAIKTLNLGPTDRHATVLRLAQEARNVSRLSHPHIVTLYDAGESDGEPYLVFEYVPGETLARVLERESRLPLNRAVTITIQILEGVACAHEHKVLHRDLKPGNIIFDAAGRARIADFGISTSLSAVTGEGFAGTPLYAAPEYVARGEFLPQSDLYAVAAMLYEMISGRTAAQGDTVKEVLKHVVQEDPSPPSRHNSEVDEKLDALVLRGLVRRPGQRYSTAREMIDALRAWLEPETPPELTTEANQSTIEFLLRRMRVKSEFPALSHSIRSINRIASSDKESASTLGRVILKDFALTNRLLKLVNAATFGQYGKVSTISRAVVIVGFEVVRSMAVTLLFLDHLQNKAQAESLKEDVVGSLLSGLFARQIAGGDLRDNEEAYICAVYQNLGRLLATYYFYEESQEIGRLMASKHFSEGRASSQVLGVSYEQLGIEIAKTWNFPERILYSMSKIDAGKAPPQKTADDRVRAIANLADELREITTTVPADESAMRLKQISDRYADSMHFDVTQLRHITQSAVQEITKEASLFNLDLKNSEIMRQARTWAVQTEAGVFAAMAADNKKPGVMGETDLESTLIRGEGNAAAETVTSIGSKPENAASILSAGIQDITNTLVSEYQLNDLLSMIMETMFRGMGFARVLLVLRDVRSGLMAGRFALGEDSDNLVRQFSFPLTGNPDLFRLAVSQGRDILISDARAEKVQAQLPEWYLSHIHAPAFVLFPILVGKNPVGLIYADMLGQASLKIAREEANLLVTLRNQAVLAFKNAATR